jgi:hypothetical protein
MSPGSQSESAANPQRSQDESEKAKEKGSRKKRDQSPFYDMRLLDKLDQDEWG